MLNFILREREALLDGDRRRGGGVGGGRGASRFFVPLRPLTAKRWEGQFARWTAQGRNNGHRTD